MIKQDIDLSVCTALRTLILDGNEPACPAIVSFLSEVAAPHLHTVVLPFVAKVDPGSIPSFLPLAEPMASKRMTGLRELRFVYTGVPDWHLVMDKLRRELPDVEGRGVVRLAVDPDFKQPVATSL